MKGFRVWWWWLDCEVIN